MKITLRYLSINTKNRSYLLCIGSTRSEKREKRGHACSFYAFVFSQNKRVISSLTKGDLFNCFQLTFRSSLKPTSCPWYPNFHDAFFALGHKGKFRDNPHNQDTISGDLHNFKTFSFIRLC